MDKLIFKDIIADIIKEADEAHKKSNEPFAVARAKDAGVPIRQNSFIRRTLYGF